MATHDAVLTSKIFLPYVWPYHDKKLQFRAVLVGACLLATNALNVLVPNQMGVMIDSLTEYTKDSMITYNIDPDID